MSNDFGKYTRDRVSDNPVDFESTTYLEYKEKVPQFLGQAVYIYSFEKNKMLYTHEYA